MKLILCLDDRNGISFNNRRQSRDREVIKHIIEDNAEQEIWIEPYSKELFKEEDRVYIKEIIASQVKEGIACFIERKVDQELLEKADCLELYFWNRKYPGDVFFEFDQSEWKQVEERKFTGFSHEEITRKKYIKGDKNGIKK